MINMAMGPEEDTMEFFKPELNIFEGIVKILNGNDITMID